MNYEQKYNDLINRLREYRERFGNPLYKEIGDEFPELAESEDERIRKEMIEYFHGCIRRNKKSGFREEQINNWIAYLKKQKEQKPAKLNDDTETGLDRALQIVKAARGSLCGYQSDDGIYECDHAIQTLERILKDGIEQLPAEWSEEDENKIESIKGLITMGRFADTNTIRLIRELLDSIRPQPHWKPSEEQMEALEFIITDQSCPTGLITQRIISLIDDLKKL